MKGNSIKILLIEDNPADACLIKEMLLESDSTGFIVEAVNRLSNGIEYLKNHAVDVVLLDLTLPDSTGMATFEKLSGHAPRLPIIVLTGLDDERMAIESMRSGLQDYLVKNKVDGELLARSIQYSIERKRLEEALRMAVEEELKDSKEQADLYIDLMVHDISNMYQVAMFQLDLVREIMEEDGKLESNNKELINTPIQTLERSAKLIDNVRKLKMLKAGKYKTEAVDLGGLLADVIDEYVSVPGADTAIRYVPAPGYRVMANLLLKDVFANIIDNAIKYTNGTASIGVDISKADVDGRSLYCVAIEDDGPGIPDARRDEIFHRFKRGSPKAGGTGLGLYIVRTLTESFGGFVKVEDRVPGDYKKGSRFLVYLPSL